MTTITTTDLEAAVEDAAAYLYVWALKDIPQDLRDALADAATKETSVPGQRVLRDRRRHARSQPHDGQLAARVRRLRTAGGQGRRREGPRMSAVATDLDAAVSDAAAHLYVWALKDIPQDLRDALADAGDTETSVPGQRVLQTILRLSLIHI